MEISAERGLLFHFTHIDNLPRILQEKALFSDARTVVEGCIAVEAGDPTIKARRRSMEVTRGPRGAPSDYVPFYFAPRSPMLYKISKGEVPTYRHRQQDLIYLVTDVAHVIASGRPWVYSDGNCANRFTEYHEEVSSLPTAVDWTVMNDRMWNDTAEEPDRMRRRMAEFLVHDHLPLMALIGVATRNEPTSQAAQNILGTNFQRPVVVMSDWYY